jgi:DNA processing protein
MSKAHCLLLAYAIEPGSKFWNGELSLYSSAELVERIKSGVYGESETRERVRRKIIERSSAEIEDSILAIGARFITSQDSEWPDSLNQLQTPPIGLIVKGLPIQGAAVALVGTRNPTPYGARVASEFAAGFADREYVVVSGGAYGIDTHAHRGALAAEGKTFAILASGVDIMYPAGNERLFYEIAENGALISEAMPGERARPERFLIRNRLIAAISQATIVVEAAFRSGSLRTAREAAELMRIVMAVPGPITSPASDGCHRLIGERCAEVVTSVSDAMELMTALSGTLLGDVT